MSVTIVVLWFGCLTAFLSSKHQGLLAKPLMKCFSISVFVVCLMASIWLLTYIYNPIASALMVLAFTMFIWLSLVLQLGHVKAKLVPLSCFNLIFWVAVVQLGGQHVA
ncbi:hypothetical protein FM037_08465 [Shewanella psychropiezotolerans]|uniref:DUF3325 domain-containing protein n=1 Tax=Shewanella psychropiezotolerans TaxID=2593655 RepID=A0ABX5X1U7_9GAMM|nr:MULTISPECIES: hypothetical protein [Shewanella]MPY22424.1 hypothetical protein [Shewanella sp. YLB-07]QDO83256.1 hypothetical protein FM037_08465 [Shewanella psychropiezotolerans]